MSCLIFTAFDGYDTRLFLLEEFSGNAKSIIINSMANDDLEKLFESALPRNNKKAIGEFIDEIYSIPETAIIKFEKNLISQAHLVHLCFKHFNL